MFSGVRYFFAGSWRERPNPSLPTLKQVLEIKPKKSGEAQIKTNESKCKGIVDISQVKRRRPNPSIPTPMENYWRQITNQKMGIKCKKAKLIVAKTKARTDLTSYLIDVFWDCRLWYPPHGWLLMSKVTNRMRNKLGLSCAKLRSS